MNKKYFNVPVYLRDNNARIVEGVIQYDTGNLFNIKIYDSTDAFDFTGYSMIVLKVVRPDGTEYIDKEGDGLDIINAADGRLALTLPDSLVSQPGMHMCSVEIYSHGVKLTTARFNYYVQKSVGDGEDIINQSEYPMMQKILTQMSLILDAEQMRMESEALRNVAEGERVSVTAGIVAQAQALVSQAMSYAKAAQDWYTLLISYAGDLTGVDLTGIATKEDITQAISAIDCGVFTGASTLIHQMRRGGMENLPTLADGEPAFANGHLYVGTESGNILVNGPAYVAQATAPDNTEKLWIDTANGNAIKFYDGEKWTGTATATFG